MNGGSISKTTQGGQASLRQAASNFTTRKYKVVPVAEKTKPHKITTAQTPTPVNTKTTQPQQTTVLTSNPNTPSMSAYTPSLWENVKSGISSLFGVESTNTPWTPEHRKQVDNYNQERREKINNHIYNGIKFAFAAPLVLPSIVFGASCLTMEDKKAEQKRKDERQRMHNVNAVKAFREFMGSENTTKALKRNGMSFNDFERRLDTRSGKNTANGNITKQNVQDYFSTLDDASKQKFDQKELKRMLDAIAPASTILPLGVANGFKNNDVRTYNYAYDDGADIDYREKPGSLSVEAKTCRGKYETVEDETGIKYDRCRDDDILNYDDLERQNIFPKSQNPY